MKNQKYSLVGIDVKRLHGRHSMGDTILAKKNKAFSLKNLKQRNYLSFKRIRRSSSQAIEKTSHYLGLRGSYASLGQAKYPSKPEVRKRHWFAVGVIICLSSWASINSTASIKKTSLDSIGLEEPPITPTALNLLGDSQQAHLSSIEEIVKPIALIEDKHVIDKNTDTNLTSNLEVVNYVVKPGDTLGRIFEKFLLPKTLPGQIVATKEGRRLKNISVGKTLSFELDNGEFRSLRYRLSALKQLSVAKNDDGKIAALETAVDYETRTKVAQGAINSSLFLAASEAGISDNLIMELAGIFGWDIDFVRDIRKGDSFKLIYEQHHKNGDVLTEGNILAAEFINKNTRFSAIRFKDSKGETGYYSEDGRNMRGTFLKSPMKVSRVSSGFTRKRFHPVLKRWRAHKGVDYAAGRGTPIRSTANGKITYKGTKGGYGRTVIISHGGKYSTLYAHLNKYGKSIRSGSYVKQGQTIGYVGSSGLATGPHLHYEFRVNGVHRNPLTFKTPKATPVRKADLPQFKRIATQQVAILNGDTEEMIDIQIATSKNNTQGNIQNSDVKRPPLQIN